MDSELLSEREVLSEYRLKISWMRRARREKRGPVFLKFGRRMVRYRRKDIEAYLSAHVVQTLEADK
jgi:predicted DNA-binding transcriptional regulator AlpA